MIFDNGVAFIQGPILIQKVKNHIALKILELLGILLLQVYSWTKKKNGRTRFQRELQIVISWAIWVNIVKMIFFFFF